MTNKQTKLLKIKEMTCYSHTRIQCVLFIEKLTRIHE
jgi:hypothetical protein